MVWGASHEGDRLSSAAGEELACCIFRDSQQPVSGDAVRVHRLTEADLDGEVIRHEQRNCSLGVSSIT